MEDFIVTENNIMESVAVEETVVPAEEAAVAETPAEETSEAAAEETAEEAAPAKKKGRGKKALLAIVITVLVLGFGAGAFLLGRNTEFDPLAIFTAADRNETAEPPVFLGIWSDDEYTLSVSAGGILDINGTAYSYTTEGKIIVIRDSSGTEYRLGWKKASNTLMLWLDGERDDSVSLRKEIKNDPEDLYGTWYLGDVEVTFNEDGTAEIYGKEYTYTADGFEITCVSEAGTEYMFYDFEKDFLILALPAEINKTLRFVSENSIIPLITGTWVNENGYEYTVYYPDGSVELRDFSGFSNYEYGDTLEACIEGNKLIMLYSGYKFVCDIEVDGDCMKTYYLGELMETAYCVSRETDITPEDVKRLWDMYTPTEAA